jgi:hypothetical protein
MGLFDVVDLHAALVDTRSNPAAEAFSTIMNPDFVNTDLEAALRRYPGRIGDDLVAAAKEIRTENSRVVEEGVLVRRTDDGHVKFKAETLSMSDFEAKLLRALRNTKHGFAIRDSALLSMHTGALHNDLPDYAVALLLGLISNRSRYTLSR